MSVLTAVLFWLLPLFAVLAVTRSSDTSDEPRLPRPAASSVLLWLLVAVPSAIQFFHPTLETGLRRDWTLIRAGQVWRLVTSAVVQDGGLGGTLFNLAILVMVILAAQDHWPAWRTWATFWAGAVAASLIVGPSLSPVGAGNSMATFTVAIALATNVLLSRAPRPAAITAAAALACVGALMLCGNYHGFACLPGLLFGLGDTRSGPRHPKNTTAGSSGNITEARQR